MSPMSLPVARVGTSRRQRIVRSGHPSPQRQVRSAAIAQHHVVRRQARVLQRLDDLLRAAPGDGRALAGRGGTGHWQGGQLTE